MSDAFFAVGVDAGGTTTRALLTRGGVTLGQGEASGGNYRWVGAGQVIANIRAAVREAFRQAGMEVEEGSCRVHVGLAGLATAEDEVAFAREPHPFARLTAQSDATLTLDAYFAGGRGVLLIVGTGCIALARGANGELRRRMGWGFPLEQGGGADLGVQAVRLGLRDWEAGANGALADVLGSAFASPRAVMEWARGAASGDYARFAPHLFAAADAGDGRATDALAAWRALCGDLVDGLAREVDAPHIGTWGGLAARLGWEGTDPRWRPPRAAPLEWAARRAER